MMNKKIFTCIAGVSLLLSCSSSEKKEEDHVQGKHIIANPLNLNYRFQFDEPSRREAADPVLEYFKGKYYLFASKSGGYWSSPDLYEWTYIPCKTITTIEGYAPTILVHNDSLYYLGSGGNPQIFKTANPDVDSWEAIDTKFHIGMTDPAFFKDDNGDVYLYWGCSDVDPIMGAKVDPADGFRVIEEPVILIEHNTEKYGWEVPGDDNEEPRIGWNEGPCVIKHHGKYYLQYAAPGTQYRIYGDGLYLSDNPLGPYTYVENSPFSFKPGGFIGGAGHGHTFKDKYGNYWHIATMKISVRHMFERRLGLFPAYLSESDNLHTHTVLTDYPFYIPNKNADFANNDCSMSWNILSYGKKTSASSSLIGYEPENAADEAVETWWSAVTGDKGEWWQVDLSKEMDVNAIQVNFADHDFFIQATDMPPVYQYYIEFSSDGKTWHIMADRRNSTKDCVHELIIPDQPVKARYVKITNASKLAGKFSLYDLRIFGYGRGSLPEEVAEVKAERDSSDTRIIGLSWPEVKNTTGYIVRWGVKKEEMKNAEMVYTNAFKRRFFNRDTEYWFAVDAINENGVTKGTDICNVSF